MNYRFPTLDVDDLRSPTFDNEAEYSFRETGRERYGFGQESGIATNEQTNDSRQLYALLAESRRLTTENAALRHCLILTKEHSDLKSANYIASAMTWCDDNLRKYTTGKDTSLVCLRMDVYVGGGGVYSEEGGGEELCFNGTNSLL